MPVYKRTRKKGITSETTTYVGAPRTGAELRADKEAIHALVAEQNRRATFDGRVADLERICRRTTRLRRKGTVARRVFGSRAWYAKEILMSIQAVRSALQQNNTSWAASEAVIVGALAAEAEAKFVWGDLLLRDARRAKNRELSLRSAAARREQIAEQNRAIISAVKEYRIGRPNNSVRAMSASIAPGLDMRPGTLRARLRKLQIG